MVTDGAASSCTGNTMADHVAGETADDSALRQPLASACPTPARAVRARTETTVSVRMEKHRDQITH